MLERLASSPHRPVGWRKPVIAGAILLLVGSLAALAWHPLLAAALVVAGLVALAAAHNVSTRPGNEDRFTAERLMAAAGRPSMRPPSTFDQEVDLAYLVQEAVFDVAPFEKRDPEGRKVSLPAGSPRELSDLVAAQTGYCFDRSRAIETLLRLHGMKARHVNIFAIPKGSSGFRTLLTRDAPSHSLTEVKTRRGWMAIDSNFRFVGLSAGGQVFDMASLAQLPDVEWDSRSREVPPKITQPFAYVYGLYSRHGRFYPPYTPFPNVNWFELLQNLPRLWRARRAAPKRAKSPVSAQG